jgi:DNA processing protein
VGAEITPACAWLRLSLIPGLTGVALRRLIDALGSPEAILESPRSALLPLVEPALVDAIICGPSPSRLDAALSWATVPQQTILVPDDRRYPALLRESADPPPVLYAAGHTELLQLPAIAVVGSRNATAQGMRNAEDFARAFSEAGCCVVSGLALGIDAAAHRGGLSGCGSSIAVLGNGIDVLYPRRNATLSAELMAHGLVLSEFALGTAPLPANFPRRNRVIGGISRGCLVVEAAIPSGSLITARIAADLGRDVFAIPGSIHSPLAKGCHHLIKQGAKLVECAQDVLEELNIDAKTPVPRRELVNHDPQAAHILDVLGHDPCSIDLLLARTGLSIDQLLSALTELEIRGHVSILADGRYQRIE